MEGAYMIQYLVWGIAFFALYISFVWINFLYLVEPKKNKPITYYPTVTIAVPAYNEEKGIEMTIRSLMALDYPKDKLKIAVINDGSSDKTLDIATRVAKLFPQVIIIDKKNGGKAAALNTCLEKTKTELFACVDADSTVNTCSLKKIIPLFDSKTASVISAIKVNKPKTIYEKLQRFEYIIAILSRKLMASIDTLAMTPGVLSVYKTQVLKDVGMFDQDNITEDFEIALRLKYHGHSIKIAEDAITWTNVPKDFMTLWRQRIRWYRGFIDNHVKYKDMFFSKKYGVMGYFQLPLNIAGVVFLLVAISIVTFAIFDKLIEFLIRTFSINNYFLTLFDLPTLREFVLGQNLKIMLPIYIGTISGFFLFYMSHKEAHEPIKNPVSLWAYFFLLPYLTCIHWFGAIFEHIFRVNKKW